MTTPTPTFERSRRADWLLFRMHYLRTLGPLALVCFGTFAVIFIISRFVGAMRPAEKEQIAPLLDGIATMLATVVALPAGASVFSRTFKEQHVLFFHTLPVPRLRQWFLLGGASACALVTIYAGFFLIRPGWTRAVTQSNAAVVPAAIAVLSFSVGLCFSLVFARTVFTYVSAYLAALLLPLLAVLLMLAPAMAYELANLSADPISRVFERSTDTVPGVVGLLIVVGFSLTFAALSAIFYVRGENTLLRIQMRNFVVAAAIGLLAAVAIATAGTGLLGRDNPVGSDYQVSPDGRSIALRELRNAWSSNLRVVDVATGTTTAPNRHDGLVDFDWTPRGDLRLVVREVSLYRRLAGHVNDRLETWSPDGRLLSTHPLPGSLITADSNRARTTAALVDRELLRIVAINDGARPVEMVRIPRPLSVWIHDGVVFARSDELPPRAWRITGTTARDLGRVTGSGRDEPLVFGDTLYRNPQSVLADVERDWPVPRSPGDGVRYGIRAGASMRTIYALAGRAPRVSLFAGDIATRQWKLIASDVLATSSDVGPGKVTLDAPVSASITLTRSNEVVTYAQRTAEGTTHSLYDARRGTTLLLYRQPPDDRLLLHTRVRSVPGVPGLFAAISAGERPVAELIVGDQGITRLSTLASEPLLALLHDGAQLRRHGDLGIAIWSRNGTARGLYGR